MRTTLLVGTILAIAAWGQAPQNAHNDAAKRMAGARWASAYNFFCVAPKANAATDPPIQPTKVFDNLYAIGDSGTTAYALVTSQGIILIDSLPANQTESVLLPGLKAVGLDPANVKYVIVTHGHGDHSGGSFFFQERYGAHVALSSLDWDGMQPAAGKAKAAANNPRRDVELKDGDKVTLGDVTVTAVLTPGHTPGSLGLIFPVKDGNTTRQAGMFGGTILLPGRPDVPTLQTYLASIAHFKEATSKAGVTVEIQNHPLMDDPTRLTAARDHKAGTPHPWVVNDYPVYLDVMAECLRAQRPELP
jgi:metallo-beta-lactamase class B